MERVHGHTNMFSCREEALVPAQRCTFTSLLVPLVTAGHGDKAGVQGSSAQRKAPSREERKPRPSKYNTRHRGPGDAAHGHGTAAQRSGACTDAGWSSSSVASWREDLGPTQPWFPRPEHGNTNTQPASCGCEGEAEEMGTAEQGA